MWFSVLGMQILLRGYYQMPISDDTMMGLTVPNFKQKPATLLLCLGIRICWLLMPDFVTLKAITSRKDWLVGNS